jgi:hypothetical protein
MEAGREFLRHTLATLAYRGGKALRGAPSTFGTFNAGPSTRTPGQILAHLGDLLDWALSQAEGKQRWSDSAPQAWDSDVQRFFRGLETLDAYLASNRPLGYPPEAIFQGAIADALTHIGQINMLRRLAGAPVRGENYFRADIVAGRVGLEQTAARKEFD